MISFSTVLSFSTVDTPWGPSQETEHVAPGITFHSTASHGGYELSIERLESMPPMLRQIVPWAGEGWYEEDLDANLVVIAFPDQFSDFQLWSATKSLTAYAAHDQAKAYLASPQAAKINDRVAAFVKSSGHLYVCSTMASSGSGWNVAFTRISDGKRATAGPLSTDEAFPGGPVDLNIYGARVVYGD